jgi:phage terminase large subunit
MVEIILPHKFQPRGYQLPLYKSLDKGIKKAVLVWSRGAGKDLTAMNYLIKRAMQQKGVYLHCFPNFNQAKRAIWNSVHNTHDDEGISYLDHIPPEIIKRKNSSEMTIEFINGSIYSVMGVDGKNAIRARGMNPSFVIMSEYAFMDDQSWKTIEPRVSQNNGTVIWISTPNGQNHFYQLYNHAKINPEEYYTSLVTAFDVGSIDEKHIQALRDEGTPEDFIQQEYFCSFTRGAEGSYYGKLIQKIRDENRINELLIDTEKPIHTAWDIGFGDYTAIWWFQEGSGGSYNFLNYYANSGEGMRHYIDKINAFKDEHNLIYGKHFLPHDVSQGEWTTGETRINMLREFGIQASLLTRDRIEDGIQAVRSLLPKCYFDGHRCKFGIQSLDFYQRKWNEAMKVYSEKPLHNKHSHGADAFRYAAMGIKTIGLGDGGGDDDMKAINKYFGY